MENMTANAAVSSDNSALSEEESTLLRIDGLVAQSQVYASADLTSLPRFSCTEDFHCDHKGTAPGRVWQGISLLEVLQLAGPLPAARFVRVHAPNYSVPLLLTELDGALLVDHIDGQPLSADTGAPWRLYVPGGQCHISVKWVNRLQLTAERGASGEERMERARQRGRIPEGAD